LNFIISKRAAIYVRVSTDKQTVENQVRELRQIAERREWDILPDGGRSIVFIPPCSLDFGVRHSRWIAFREGPVKRVSGNQCALAPEWSEHFPDHRVRNVWSCEACGYEFEDTVYWRARELVDAE